MTQDEAIALYDSRFWEEMSHRERAVFQLHEERLCMPFGVFQEAMEKALGRPVWTHEFASPDRLKAELNGASVPPTFEEILALLPAGKRLYVVSAQPEMTDNN